MKLTLEQIDKMNISEHKKEIKKWKSKEVKDRFNSVGSSTPDYMINYHKVCINQLRNK